MAHQSSTGSRRPDSSEVTTPPAKPVALAPRLVRWNIAALVVLTAVVLFAFSDVAFVGRTFSTSWQVLGTNGVGPNGVIPPVGSGVDVPVDSYRIDRGASAWAFEPWAQVVHRIITERELPLWNPYQGGGTPLAANMQSAVFDPLLLPVHLHPSLLVWDLSFLIALIAVAWFSYLFFRSLGLGTAASMVGSAAFAISGYFLLYSNDQFFRSYLFVPLLLFLVDRVIRSDRIRWVGLLGAALAANIFVGMPEASLAVISLAGAYAAFRWLTFARTGERGRAALRLSGAGALGLCLASPLLLLFFQYVSVGWTGHPPGAGTGLYSDPKRNLLPWVAPFIAGKPSIDPDGVFNGARDWIGSGALMLILFGLTSRREMWRRPGVFFAAAAALLLLKIYGFPVVQVLGRLPAFSQANFPVFFVPVFGFCLAALVAFGAQAIADRSWYKWALFVELGVTVAAGAWLLHANAPALRAATGSDTAGQFGLAMVAAGVVLVAALSLSAAQAKWVVALAVVGELIILAPHGFYASRADPYRPPPWLTAVGYGAPQNTDRVFAFDAKLFPNTAGVYGIQDIRSLDAVYPSRYVKYISTFIQPDFGTRFVGGAYGQLEGAGTAQIVGNPMVDLLGVRYFLSSATVPNNSSLAAVSAQREPSATSTPTAVVGPPPVLVSSSGGVDVYENQDRLPRAFVAHNITYVPNMDSAVHTLTAGEPKYADGAVHVTRFHPRDDAIIEGSSPAKPASGPCVAGADAARITAYAAGEVSIDVNSSCRGFLVLSDTFFPGWDATVNGQPATIHPTDVLFRGVAVDKGHSVVVFRYRPGNFGIGLLLALASMMALAAAAVWRRVRMRRSALDVPSGAGQP